MTPTPPADTGPGLNAWYLRLEAVAGHGYAAGPSGAAPSTGEPESGVSSLGSRAPAGECDGRWAAPNPDRGVRGHPTREHATRAGYGSGGLLSQASAFTDLAALWLADLGHQGLAEGTKKNYREALRQFEPVFEYYTLGEFTTGRIERFLREEHGRSYSRAKHARTILNLLFGFVLRHDAIPRNPLEGISRL